MNEETIFTKIANREIPAVFVYEDDEFMAILDISQFVEGHTIVIPKEHYEIMWDMPDDVFKRYWAVIKKIADYYREGLGFEYVDTLTMGRMVPHSHVHLIPHNGDENDWEDGLEAIAEMQEDEDRRMSMEELEEIGDNFRYEG